MHGKTTAVRWWLDGVELAACGPAFHGAREHFYAGDWRSFLRNQLLHVLEDGVAAKDEEHGGAGSAQSDAKNSRLAGKRREERKQRRASARVRLVEPVLHGDVKKLAVPFREGGGEERDALHVEDGVCRVYFSGSRPRAFLVESGESGSTSRSRQSDLGLTEMAWTFCWPSTKSIAESVEAAEPAGGDVIGMAFADAGFAEDVALDQPSAPKVGGERDASEQGGRGGSAAHAERDLVVDLDLERGDRLLVRGEDAGVGVDSRFVFELAAGWRRRGRWR